MVNTRQRFYQRVESRMGTEAAPSSSSFFRILLIGFTEELILPRKFSTIALMEENMNAALFVNPNGQAWRVSARRDERNIYMGGRGWHALVQAHGLRFGFLLVFKYVGNSEYHFRVFDLSTCEIAYPSAAKETKPTPVFIQIDDDDDGENETKPTPVFIQIDDVVVVEDDKEERANTSGSSKARSKKGPAKSRATESSFEVKLSACNITRGRVYIPVRFGECVGFRPEQRAVTVKDPQGRMWTVGLWRRNDRSLSNAELKRGWKRLACANKLKAGDRCAFELIRRQGKGHGMVWGLKINYDH